MAAIEAAPSQARPAAGAESAVSGTPGDGGARTADWFRLAQTPPRRPGPGPAPSTGKDPPQAPASPRRFETIVYENWTFSCQEPLDKSGAKVCSIVARVTDPRSKQVALVWYFGFNNQRQLTTQLQTPTGIRIQPGVEIELGKNKPRSVPFTLCEPQQCTAVAPVDDAFLKEFNDIPDALVSIVLRDGRRMQFKIPMRGFEPAVTALRQAK